MQLPWRKSPEKKISEFWQWFSQNVSQGEDLGNPRIQNEVTKRLRAIHPDLCWGGGLGHEGDTPFFEVSCDGIKAAIPAVESVVAGVPEIPGWRVWGFRRGQPMNDVEISLGENISISADSVFWRELDRSEGLVHLQIFVPHEDETVRTQVGFIMLDHTLGEYVVMTKLGELDFQDSRTGPEGLRPLRALPEYLGVEIS